MEFWGRFRGLPSYLPETPLLGGPAAIWAAEPIRTKAAGFGNLEMTMLSVFRRLMKNVEGATAIEYTLIASLIAVAAIASMRTVGGKVSNVLSNVANAMG